MFDGAFVLRQRDARGLAQGELAAALGVSRPTYALIERGERELTVSEAQKLAAVFEMTLEELLAEQAPKRRVTLPAKTRAKKSSALHIRVTEKNVEKFKQVLLYVLARVGSRPNVGETVLHKLLYFIDFDYYEKFEENLMGATYIKNHYGPTSAELSEVIAAMQTQKEIEAVKSRHFKFEMKKYLPLKPPDLAVLSAQEIAHIDGVLARLADKNAAELSRHSHGDIPWLSTPDGQPISYERVFYRDETYSVRHYDDEL